jgi:hypothetical protein
VSAAITNVVAYVTDGFVMVAIDAGHQGQGCEGVVAAGD